MNVQDVEGIGPTYAEQLAAAGITTTDHLLERGARPRGRAAIAEATGISPKLVLEWVNHVDLMRLDGVGSQYADLLSLAGVDSPLELARRNPGNLARTFAEIDAARPGEVRRVPSEETVIGWVEQAKGLARAVFHDDARADEPAPDDAPVADAEPVAYAIAATGVAAAPEPAAKAASVAEAGAERDVAEPVAEPDVAGSAPVAEAVAEPAPEPAAEPEPGAVDKPEAVEAAVAEPAPEPAAEPAAVDPLADIAPLVAPELDAAASAASEPVVDAIAARPQAAPGTPAPERLGLWARIKRMVGMG